MQVGACAWNCGRALQLVNISKVMGLYLLFTNVPSDYDTCKAINRTGTLCGRCLPDHYPLTYSFSFTCAKCHHIRWNWVRYIMAAYLPLTLFYLIVLFFKINVVSGSLSSCDCFQSRGVNAGLSSGFNVLFFVEEQESSIGSNFILLRHMESRFLQTILF